MGLRYLDGRSWTEVTRDERFFCQHLFGLIRQHGPAKFVSHVNRATGASLPVEGPWEPAFEACFYRDLWHQRGRKGDLFSPKRTFDLCLFSEDAILIIEAKAQQSFESGQLGSFAADREQVRKETGVATVLVVGLASSACKVHPGVSSTFDGPLLTWKALASVYSDDAILLRADAIHEPHQSGDWGKNNQSGHMTGEALFDAFQRGERFLVGRGGGLDGPKLTEDLRTGGWRAQHYETDRVSPAPVNRNWFRLEEFAARVSKTA